MSEHEIISAPSETPESLVETTQDIISTAERRIEMMQKVKILALKSTNNDDWVDQQGKPYLTASGAEKVARLFGVKIRNVKQEKIVSSDEKGDFYYYLVTGVAELKGGGDFIEAVGTCSSKDQFFAKKGGNLKPLSEIDETNILKAAYSNFIGNAITRLLGIRNMTWEELKESGVDQGKVARVEYSGSSGTISPKQVSRLWAIAKKDGWGEQELKDWLLKEFKIDGVNKIPYKKYDDIVAASRKAKGIDENV